MEHSRFIASLFDQSEKNLVKSALKFGDDFETLLNQARDVESMLYHKQPTYPIIGKMNKDSENAAFENRAFKAAGLELIKTCQIRNVINPLLVRSCSTGSRPFSLYDPRIGRAFKHEKNERTTIIY